MSDPTAPVSPRDTPFPRPGSSLFHALRITPLNRRPALRLWLAWWHEVARIPFDVHDAGVAESKLRWWLQELQASQHGQAHHPLMRQFSSCRLPDGCAWPAAASWTQQADSLIQLVHQTRWLEEAHFLRHAQASTGEACAGAARVLGASSDEAIAAARQIGVGLRLAHRLGRLGQDARAGWVLVGIDLLQRHNVKAHQLTRPDAQQPPEGWPALLAELHASSSQALHAGLKATRALPPKEAKDLKPLVALAHMALAQSAIVAGSGDAVLHQRLVLTPMRKGWIAQKVAWGWLT